MAVAGETKASVFAVAWATVDFFKGWLIFLSL
jgi:hypothetical protein